MSKYARVNRIGKYQFPFAGIKGYMPGEKINYRVVDVPTKNDHKFIDRKTAEQFILRQLLLGRVTKMYIGQDDTDAR